MSLAVLMLAAAAFTAAGQDQKIQRAREHLKEARRILDESRENLEAAYLELETEFKRISGSYTLQFLRGLEAAWSGILEELKSGLEADKGRINSRRRFEDYAAPILETTAVKHVLDLDPRLLAPFVKEGSSLLYDKIKKGEAIDDGDIHLKLAEVLSPGVPFYTFWNERLYQGIEQARAFAQANEDFQTARTDLDRLEHPERYTSKGKQAPPRMVSIPAGSYTVGPNTGWDKPRRRAVFREFYIDKYEITNQEYRDFLKSLPPEKYNDYVPYFWPMNQNMERVFPEEKGSWPVSGVSWKAANAYAEWCGKRLPTEEEWEVAARGKEGHTYPWGDRFDPLRCNTREAGLNRTREVGAFPGGASPFGCMDMSGNVYEWTSTDQEGNRVLEVDDEIRNMVIRGGDFNEGADHARADFRWMTPMDPYAGRHPSKKQIGFRCVKNVD
jgi:iron(II)-dependent oxidoreductase